jgi:ABC-2 type transport system permease protein
VRSVTPYALGLAFGMYVLNALNGIFDEVAIEWITPFKHFDAPAIATSGQYDSRLVLFNITISLVALGVSYWLYQQRDIHAVS